MKITLSPQRRDDGPISITKQGDVLTIAGTAYDLSQLPDGGTLPQDAVDCPWLAGDINRIDNELELTLLLPHGANAPEQTRFPEPIIDPADGTIELPPYDIVPEPEEETEE
jgi:hypothetical protein